MYAKLFEEVMRDLHKGCNTMTRLSFVIKVLVVQIYHKYMFLINSISAYRRHCENWLFPGLTTKLRVLFMNLVLVMRPFTYASLTVLCSGENTTTCNIPDFWKVQKSQNFETFVFMLMQATKNQMKCKNKRKHYGISIVFELPIQICICFP